jgi:DNA excision repair protein ERCC-5
VPDADLREYQREMALSAISKRHSQKKLAPLSTNPIQIKSKSTPLFAPDEDEYLSSPRRGIESDDDIELAFAIQQSLDQEPDVLTLPAPGGSTSSLLSLPEKNDICLPHASPGSPVSSPIAGPSKVRSPSMLALPSRSSPPSLFMSANDSDSDGIEVSTQAESSHILHSIPTSEEVSDADDMEAVIRLGSSFPISPINNSSLAKRESILPITKDVSSDHFMSDDESPESILDHRSSLPTPAPRDGETERLGTPLLIEHSRTESDHEIESNSSGSPSPVPQTSTMSQALVIENWDAAHEMDPEAEEGEFARFISQVKGKDLDDVRREIDDEIKSLNQQKMVAMRDSDDITNQMISQIMVCPADFLLRGIG